MSRQRACSGKGSGHYDYRLTLIDPASGEPRCADETYLKPEFVNVLGVDGRPGQLPGALVKHHSSLKRNDDRLLLTRFDQDGRALWTREPGGEKLKFAVAVEGLLVVVGDFTDGVAIGFDAATGVERWRTRF